jgi:carbon-monoxide dehydrogenase small subunit
MTSIELKVNGRAIQADVTPRTHLADFLREHLLLTGTHRLRARHLRRLHGLSTARSPAPASPMRGLRRRRRPHHRGFDDDPLARLRQAFSAEHALQCGYLTPGMLVAARDLIPPQGWLRAEIRTEMSGNPAAAPAMSSIVSAIEGVMAPRCLGQVRRRAGSARAWPEAYPTRSPLPSADRRASVAPRGSADSTKAQPIQSTSVPSRTATVPPTSRKASSCRIRSTPCGS